MAVSIDRPCSTSPRCHTCTRKDEARYAVRGIALRSARERCVPPRVPCVPTCRRPSAWRARLGHAAGALPLQRAHGVLPGGSRGVVPTGSPPKGGPRACYQRAACWRPHRRARRPATARSTRAPPTFVAPKFCYLAYGPICRPQDRSLGKNVHAFFDKKPTRGSRPRLPAL